MYTSEWKEPAVIQVIFQNLLLLPVVSLGLSLVFQHYTRYIYNLRLLSFIDKILRWWSFWWNWI